MNRKRFLAAAAGLPALTHAALPRRIDDTADVIPPYLRPGDMIGITSPAGFIDREEISPAIEQIESWGFRVLVGSTIGKRYHSFGGSDEERASDLQSMLDDPHVSAILCARGGYGLVRIVDRLRFDRFVRRPKWIIGFSDVTVLHAHVNSRLRIASIHSKMCNSFPDRWSEADPAQKDTILSIRDALTGTCMRYDFDASPCNVSGNASGILVGGNLKTIETLAGTASDLHTAGRILFVEDTGEYLYSIDRMFWNLERTGKLQDLKGLIVGGFKVKPDDPGEEFGVPLEDIITDRVKPYGFPVAFNFPVGHQKNNFALKCGVAHRLSVANNGSLLEEIG